MGFDITTNKTAVCLAIALKTGSVLPGTGSTAISTDHISTSGSHRVHPLGYYGGPLAGGGL